MYKLEDKEYQFKRVSVKDALKLKGAMTVLAKDGSTMQQTLQSDEIVNEIALKYLEVKVKDTFEPINNEDYFSMVFENEFAIIEIMATFQKHISGFIHALPSFQKVQAKAQKK